MDAKDTSAVLETLEHEGHTLSVWFDQGWFYATVTKGRECRASASGKTHDNALANLAQNVIRSSLWQASLVEQGTQAIMDVLYGKAGRQLSSKIVTIYRGIEATVVLSKNADGTYEYEATTDTQGMIIVTKGHAGTWGEIRKLARQTVETVADKVGCGL